MPFDRYLRDQVVQDLARKMVFVAGPRQVGAERRKPVLFIECKQADTEVDKGLRYLKARFPECEAWQLSAEGGRDATTPEGIRIAPALRFLSGLV